MLEQAQWILMADDSEEDRLILKLAIRGREDLAVAGMTVNGNDTINYLQGVAAYTNRMQHPYPDLLLLDFQMPRGNGLAVLEWLQKQPRRPKVILWSNMIEDAHRTAAYQLGANLVCDKPRHPPEALALIYRALSQRA